MKPTKVSRKARARNELWYSCWSECWGMLQGQLNEQGQAGNRRLVVAADVQEGDNGSSSRLDFAPYLVSLKFPIKQKQQTGFPLSTVLYLIFHSLFSFHSPYNCHQFPVASVVTYIIAGDLRFCSGVISCILYIITLFFSCFQRSAVYMST